MFNVSYHPIADDFEFREDRARNGARAVRNVQELCVWLELSADGIDGRMPPPCPTQEAVTPRAEPSSPENVPRGTRVAKAAADTKHFSLLSADKRMKKRALQMLRTGQAAFITLFLRKGV